MFWWCSGWCLSWISEWRYNMDWIIWLVKIKISPKQWLVFKVCMWCTLPANLVVIKKGLHYKQSNQSMALNWSDYFCLLLEISPSALQLSSLHLEISPSALQLSSLHQDRGNETGKKERRITNWNIAMIAILWVIIIKKLKYHIKTITASGDASHSCDSLRSRRLFSVLLFFYMYWSLPT